MVPAGALGIVSICGISESTFFSREVQSVFKPGFPVAEMVSTILVARYWNAQAEAAKIGYEHTRAADPQRSWKSVVFTVAALGFDVAYSFFKKWNNGLVLLGILLLTIMCTVLFLHSTRKMLDAARAPASARRISAYIVASVVCMIILVTVMFVISTTLPLTPNQSFVSAGILHLTRAGTGLCQVFVFFPYTPVSQPGAVGQIHPSTDATEAIGSPSPISIDTLRVC
jgi:hypothetical protein